ncbi:Wzz/FepE/Etk N-terminal domain-containing protein [Cellulosimicrobium sp. Marseille-Q8652]
MTIREFLRTVWAGKYFVLVAVLVVMAAAMVYVERQDPVFEATATVQIVAAESVPGANQEASSVTVDTDPEMIRNPAVLEPAAAALDDGTEPRVLAGSVEGFYNAELLTMSVIARAGDEAGAVRRANAVAQAYIAYLPTILDTQVAELDERREALRAQLDQIQSNLAANPDDPLAQAERDTIVGQYQAISALHSTFGSIVTPGVLVDPATSAVPLGMPTPLVLAIALLAGLVAGVGLAFARRGLDLRVRTTAEAATLAGTPVLAELFDVRGADKEFRRTGNLPVSSRHASPFTESVRELRTAVRVSLGDAPHSVAVVTAADPHAPRAFITANLAASFALSGRPTIVMCGDLRRPQLADLLPAPEGWDGSPRELRPTRIPNLRLMPVHDDEMDPADFLATARVRALVDGLREKAAIVVVDAPPVLAAADATILGGYANGVVLIASVEKTDRVVLQEAAERLRINNVPLSGMALAGVKGDRRMTYASSYGSDAPLVTTSSSEGTDEGSAADVAAAPAEAAPDAPAEGAPDTTAATPAENEAPSTRAATRTRKDGAREAGRRLEPQWAKVPPSEAESIDGEDVEEDAPNIRRRPFRW